MRPLAFERREGGVVTLNLCFPCQVIWFDAFQSEHLSQAGVIDVFKALHNERAATRNTLPALLACPICQSRLSLTHDLQHTTRFTYFRCQFGHGRLTPFFQFLLEKNFVRPVTGAELAALRAKVQSVNCSNCGAPVDLVHDSACQYCGSPISILDPVAISAVAQQPDAAQAQLQPVDVDRLVDALRMQAPRDSATPGAVGDLVIAGLGALTMFLAKR